jgi:hypothetical protein
MVPRASDEMSAAYRHGQINKAPINRRFEDSSKGWVVPTIFCQRVRQCRAP